MKLLAGLSLLFFLIFACTSDPSQGKDELAVGEQLAKVHCASCHQYPAPEFLDKKTWKNYILPRMGYMMGVLPIDSIEKGFIEESAKAVAFNNPNLFRSEATLTPEEWNEIYIFYLASAPSEMPSIEKPTIVGELPQFKVNIPAYQLSPPSTTMVKFLENGFAIGDANTRRTFFFDQKMQMLGAANTREGAVWLTESNEGYVLTSMGSFSPTDTEKGMLYFLSKTPSQSSRILIDSLKRPVHTTLADLNGDNILDFVTCEFAKWTGKLAWWKNDGYGNLQPNVLRNMPGAIKAYTHDLNKDSLLDVIALFGQGDEGIFAYYNEGNDKFREERLLQFPPSYGSSFFNLFDYEGDGDLDIIYTNGDNADYPPINKPYHGIRIFENNGNRQFKEVLFYPLQGAYQAIPKDFDQDGDLDIAAISFFPDFQHHPEESFVFLENKGDWQFKAQTFPQNNLGRWLVMDSGDLDKDGDLDILLGALTFEVIPDLGLVDQWVEKGIPFVLLENLTR